MAVQENTRPALSSKARELMESSTRRQQVEHLGAHPDERAGAAPLVHRHRRPGAGQMASGRVAANQMKTCRLLALEGIQPLSQPHRQHRQRGRCLADRIRRPAEHPADQSRPQWPPAGDQYDPLRDLDLQSGRHRACPRARPNASRTILSDKGGYTNVEGERCEAHRGDIILTPNGTWHDHGNEADAPVIWIDMLDWPLMEFLDCAWVDQDQARRAGNAKQPDTSTRRLFAQALWPWRPDADLRLAPARLGRGRPVFHYRGTDVPR